MGKEGWPFEKEEYLQFQVVLILYLSARLSDIKQTLVHPLTDDLSDRLK
jgi:hypothetical protein